MMTTIYIIKSIYNTFVLLKMLLLSSFVLASVDSQSIHARPLRVTVVRVHGEAHAIGRADYHVLAKRERRHAIRVSRVKRKVSKLLVSPRHFLNINVVIVGIIVVIIASTTFRRNFRKHPPRA